MRLVIPKISLDAVRAPRGQIRVGSGAMDLPSADARKADRGVGGSAGTAA